MLQSEKIRQIAFATRRKISTRANGNNIFTASDLNELAADYFDLVLLPMDDAEMRNALAILQSEFILYNKDLPETVRNFCIAHEIGHLILHQTSLSCDAEDISDPDNQGQTYPQKFVGYGAGERREREANLFALEFLLPAEDLRRDFLEKKLTARQISEKYGLAQKYVFSQLSYALLTPQVTDSQLSTPEQLSFDLDESQKRAAESEKTPLLISAGPGTGKTQTLIKRILYLLEKGILPERILALTFSNKAAEEMSERIAQTRPEEAKRIEIMTFHAFGLNLLRKFWQEANLTPLSPVIEPIDALLFLENNLDKLKLNHYQKLTEPTRYLKNILQAISRAKDELCSPELYQQLAEKMLAEAEDEKSSIAAEKALEVARVYQFYQEFLEREKLLDFGELIYRTVQLISQNKIVKRSLQESYDAILVDEFQDINRACGVLLKEITEDGKGLWAVGDLRQSIYRWRGASTVNLRLFQTDFPTAETFSLEVNYRSNAHIIRLLNTFARQMLAVPDNFADWIAHRQNSDNQPKISYTIADTPEREAAVIAEKIQNHHRNGIRFKEQAIICRTHKQLAKFAEKLIAEQIPVFYLGELFERDEISDLLALLDLCHSETGVSLVRVANFSEYRIPPEDVFKILAKAGAEDMDFQKVLRQAEITEELSENAKIGWQLLKKHLATLSERQSAFHFLCEYLFNQSRFLQPLLTDSGIQKQHNLLAIFQFLNFARTNEARFSEAEKPIVSFLHHVRKVVRYGDDNLLNQIPDCADKIDAVKLLTVHAAKGLEFQVVYLPYLANTKIPALPKHEPCPPPVGMLPEENNYHPEEEECLFFVAMSRAKDFLHLSRATYDRNSSGQSVFLEKLCDVLPSPDTAETTPENPGNGQPILSEPFRVIEFYQTQIEDYHRCPRLFYYRHVLKLQNPREEGVYLKFHMVLRKTISELMKTPKNVLDKAFAEQKLDEFWAETDLDEHPYSPIYRQKASEMLEKLAKRLSQEFESEPIRPTFTLEFENGFVRIQPEFMQVGDNLIRLCRAKTGKVPQNATGKDKVSDLIEDADVLLQQAVEKNYDGYEICMKKFYLRDDEVRIIEPTTKIISNRLQKYEKTLSEIAQGYFPAVPKDGRKACPNCSFYFICPV